MISLSKQREIYPNLKYPFHGKNMGESWENNWIYLHPDLNTHFNHFYLEILYWQSIRKDEG